MSADPAPAGATASPGWAVRGRPTDDELAAAVAALTAAAAAAPATPARPARPHRTSSGWAAYWRGVRAPLPPGPDAWRASGQPGG